MSPPLDRRPTPVSGNRPGPKLHWATEDGRDDVADDLPLEQVANGGGDGDRGRRRATIVAAIGLATVIAAGALALRGDQTEEGAGGEAVVAAQAQVFDAIDQAEAGAMANVLLQLDEFSPHPGGLWPDDYTPWGHVPRLTVFADGRVVALRKLPDGTTTVSTSQIRPEAVETALGQVALLAADPATASCAPAADAACLRRRQSSHTVLRFNDGAQLTTMRLSQNELADPEAFAAVYDMLVDLTSSAPFDDGYPGLTEYPPNTPGPAAGLPENGRWLGDRLGADVTQGPTSATLYRLAPDAAPGHALEFGLILDVSWVMGWGQTTQSAATAKFEYLGRGEFVYLQPDDVTRLQDSVFGAALADGGVSSGAMAELLFEYLEYPARALPWAASVHIGPDVPPPPDAQGTSGGFAPDRVVSVPWIYEGYDPAFDMARVEEARSMLDAILRPPIEVPTATVDAYFDSELLESSIDLSETATPEPTHQPYPFPPNVAPPALRFEPGIQTWMHWWSWDNLDDLRALREEGFVWYKQRFAWADLQPLGPGPITGEHSSHFIRSAKRVVDYSAFGLREPVQYRTRLLVQLDVPPAWARSEHPAPGKPPFDLEAWEDFVHRFAVHYAYEVDAYEILNEPNLQREWGVAPDPEAYAAVLHAAYRGIKRADPSAAVVTAGLAPTGSAFPEAMAPEEFIERFMMAIYNGDQSVGLLPGRTSLDMLPFDAVGAHAPGFAAPPETSPEEAASDPALGGQPFFTFRYVEVLRELMNQHEVERPFMITEFGWTTDSRPESPYNWSAIDRDTRADYIERAYRYASANWSSWLGPMILFSAADPAWTEQDEAYWWAVTDQNGSLDNALRGRLDWMQPQQ